MQRRSQSALRAERFDQPRGTLKAPAACGYHQLLWMIAPDVCRRLESQGCRLFDRAHLLCRANFRPCGCVEESDAAPSQGVGLYTIRLARNRLRNESPISVISSAQF